MYYFGKLNNSTYLCSSWPTCILIVLEMFPVKGTGGCFLSIRSLGWGMPNCLLKTNLNIMVFALTAGKLLLYWWVRHDQTPALRPSLRGKGMQGRGRNSCASCKRCHFAQILLCWIVTSTLLPDFCSGLETPPLAVLTTFEQIIDGLIKNYFNYRFMWTCTFRFFSKNSVLLK